MDPVPSTSSGVVPAKRLSLTVTPNENESESAPNSRSASPQFPHKAPKKVSFSDELPQESTAGMATATAADGAGPSSPTLKSESVKLSHFDVNPFVFMLQKNDSYLNNMHQVDRPQEPAPLSTADVFPNQRRSSNNSTADESETPPIGGTDLDVKVTPQPTSILKPSDPVPTKAAPFDPISAGLVNDLRAQSDLVDAALGAPKKHNLADCDKIEKNGSVVAAAVPEVAVSAMELEVRRDKRRWLLISELSAVLGEDKHTVDGFKRVFREQTFLQNMFRLFDMDNENCLVQDKWIEHLKGRLTEEKQMDFAEQLESVAYVLCGEGTVTYEKFCQIWHAKGILDKLYRLIDVDSTNLLSTNQIMEFISNLTNARPRTGFDKSSLERLEQLFIKTVGNEKEIRREEFKKIVTSKNPFFTERVFQIFDKDNSGSISLQEFIDAIHQFAGQSPEDKIKFLFKVYDLDGMVE